MTHPMSGDRTDSNGVMNKIKACIVTRHYARGSLLSAQSVRTGMQMRLHSFKAL